MNVAEAESKAKKYSNRKIKILIKETSRGLAGKWGNTPQKDANLY